MPYTTKQTRLFQGIKHGNIKPKRGLSKGKAAELLTHGKPKRTAAQNLLKRG